MATNPAVIDITTFDFDHIIEAVLSPGTRVSWEAYDIGMVLDRHMATGTVVKTHGGIVEVNPDKAHPVLDTIKIEARRLEVLVMS